VSDPQHRAVLPPVVLPPVVTVSGGVAGIEAEQHAAYFLAGRYAAVGDRAIDWAALGPRTVAQPDLLESALLSPVSFAQAQASVLRATVGPRGALGQSLVWHTEALLVRSAVDLMVAADELVRQAVEVRDYALGRVVGTALRGAVLNLGPVLVPVLAASLLLPPSQKAAILGSVQTMMSEHPGAVEAAFNGGGGLLDGLLAAPLMPLAPLTAANPFDLPVFHPDTGSAAAELARWYDDGTPGVRELEPAGLPDPLDAAGTQPSSLAGLVGALAGVAGLSVGASSPLNGTIAVATLTGTDARTRHIVYVPGTDDMATTPGSQDDDVRDMGTNLALMAGQDTSYGHGITAAMGDAGIRAGEPVLLVGHSQGGMVAAALAAGDSPYDIRQVVTAGAPTSQVDLPDDVRVLSLENRGDVIPLTDGEPNRGSVGQTTVQFDAGGIGLAGHHDYPQYVAGAATIDASLDPSVIAALEGLRADGFLGSGDGVRVETRVFQVTRDPG